MRPNGSSRDRTGPGGDPPLSNNPDKAAQRTRLGLTIAKRVPTALHLTGTNAAYLAAKARRSGHELLSLGLERAAEPLAGH
jgi:hypothetical protein